MKLAFFFCALLLLGAAQDASQDFDNEDEEFERAPASIPTSVSTNIPKAKKDSNELNSDEFELPLRSPVKAPAVPIAKPVETQAQSWPYVIEAVYLVLIVVFIVNFVIGSKTNKTLASNWYDETKDALVQRYNITAHGLQCETYSSYRISGHAVTQSPNHPRGVDVTISLKPRHDFFSYLMSFFKSQNDVVTVEFSLNKSAPCVAAIVHSYETSSFRKANKDITEFANKELTVRGLPSFTALALNEDSYRMIAPLEMMPRLEQANRLLNRIYITDNSSVPEHPLLFHMEMKLGTNKRELEQNKALLEAALFAAEHASSFQLGKSALTKAKELRLKAEERSLKESAKERQEQAQERKYEKLKQEKERIEKLTGAAKERAEEKLAKKQEKERQRAKAKSRVMMVRQ